jgi:uncharacterized membrane protein YphA (DoxX/SURF4 family)
LGVYYFSHSIVLKFFTSAKEQKPSFMFAHWLFGRCLGVVSLIAFLSYWSQADALIGPNGLNPWKTELDRIESFLEANEEKPGKFSLRPTLLWFSYFDNHHLLFTLGSISSIALAFGFMPGPSAALSWLCYLSLSVVGDPFLSFQWDALLLETLFLSLPLLPFIPRHRLSVPIHYSKWARVLVLLLLAKLMIESGVVKFTYFDTDESNAWIDYTALNFHYWTQPLPHTFSPLVHSLPSWFDWISLNVMYFIELVLPFFFFLPKNWRRFALFGQVILQLAILLSGNYGFFNLLTLTLCIPLIDDGMIPQKFRPSCGSNEKEKKTVRNGFHLSHIGALYFIFLSTAWVYFKSDLQGNRSASVHKAEVNWIGEVRKVVQPMRSANSYGLFRVMTKTRPEILVEGSVDGKEWKLYDFKWKPDHVDDSPGFAGPHMPRLDWQMWFEGLRAERYLSQPFPRFLYGRFLNIIANGGGQKECFDLNYVLGEEEMRAFAQAPPRQKQLIIQNFQNLMNAFLGQSKWFGEFLQACIERNLVILNELEDVPFVLQSPNFLRISFFHYQFQSESKTPNQSVWEAQKIPNGEIRIDKK